MLAEPTMNTSTLHRASVVGLKKWAYASIASLTGAAFAWTVVGDSDTLGSYVVLVAVPDPLRARLQRRSH
jgi:hypothetical protein